MSGLGLAPFQALVKQRCGLQFEGDGQAKLAQALQERCAALGLAQAAYLPYLERSAGEFQELVNLLTINETYFFREPEQIRLLVQRLVPRLLARGSGQGRLRILSAGCSTGEEPYSLAIALLEQYGDAAAQSFTLLGADIDSRALARARAATYSDFSFRGVPEALRQRHFERTRAGWRLAPAVRRLVEFHECNLLAPPQAPALQGCDVIFFRNVSIYFDLPTRQRIQQHLAQLLKDDGILVIGVAETLANNLGVLPLVEEDGLFYFAKGQPPLLPPAGRQDARPASPARAAPPRPPVPPQPLTLPEGWMSAPERTPGQAALAQARQDVQDKRYAAALPQLDAVLADAPEHTEARLLKAYVLLERKEFDAAAALAHAVLEAHAWSVDACMLLGLAAKWSGSADEAMRWFRQTIYAHHACWPAHYFLADLQRASGALEQARRTWRVVLQLLSGAAPDTGIRHLPLDLPASEIRFLCTRHLAQAGAGAAQG